MTTKLTEKQRPSFEEFTGWYNLGYDRDDGYPVLHSRKRVPDFYHGEFLELCIAESQWFTELAKRSDLLPFDPLEGDPFYLVSDADDRTLLVEAECDYVTVDIVQRMQREFLSRYPLWRIFLTLGEADCVITIYPDAVRYGNFPLGTDPEEALPALLRKAAAFRDRRLLPDRTEVRFLEERLPDAVRAIGDRPFQLIGLLHLRKHGDYRSDWERDLALLILIRGSDSRAIGVNGPPEQPPEVNAELISYCTGFDVDGAGHIVGSLYFPRPAEFIVPRLHMPADYRGPLNIIVRKTGKQSTIEINSDDIVCVDIQ